MTDFRIRQASALDHEVLAPLFDAYRQFYGRPSDLAAARDFLRARLSSGESSVFMAMADEAGAEVLGFTQLYPSFSSVSLARIWVLNDLFVSPPARQRGVARHLLMAAAAFARQTGAVRLTLSTAIANTPAQALYQSAGWQRDDQYWVYQLALSA